ncbi:MAG: hypothetical protein M5U34_10495 [Chloroflexi bacterium]|nr:hypothetical protein [Chloroflexota bacterium]
MGQVAALLNVDLPIHNELHGKIAFEDPLGVIPAMRRSPFGMIRSCCPGQTRIAASWPRATTPAGSWRNSRPALIYGQKGAWQRNPALPLDVPYRPPRSPTWPVHFAPEYADIVLRGVSRLAPGLAAYTERMSKPIVDGGYYTKTPENRPLVGPLPVSGVYVIGALSGFGIMAALAAGELLAAHITGGELPSYAPAFAPSRYDDAAYQALLANWDSESWTVVMRLE